MQLEPVLTCQPKLQNKASEMPLQNVRAHILPISNPKTEMKTTYSWLYQQHHFLPRNKYMNLINVGFWEMFVTPYPRTKILIVWKWSYNVNEQIKHSSALWINQWQKEVTSSFPDVTAKQPQPQRAHLSSLAPHFQAKSFVHCTI